MIKNIFYFCRILPRSNVIQMKEVTAMHERMVYDWYQQYKTGLYRFALSILKDTHLAEDALQDAFVRMLTLNRLPDSEKAQAWLYRVVRNICYDILRKRKRETGEAPVSAAPREGNWEFIELIAPLPQTEQEIMALRFIGGFSHKEIAKIMGMTLHGAKKRYERAIQTLRTEMEVSL